MNYEDEVTSEIHMGRVFRDDEFDGNAEDENEEFEYIGLEKGEGMESNGIDVGNRESRSVTMVVSGYDKFLPVDDIKSLLSEHFSSCGEITNVYIPTRVGSESTRNKYAFVDVTGDDAEKKALRLNGSDVGGRSVVVKVMPPSPSSECCKGTPELYVALAELKERERITPSINVVMVSGFDTSFPEYRVKDPLTKYFSACGEIRVVRVHREDNGLLYKTASVQIRGLRDVVGEKAWALNGADMGGWKAKVTRFVEPEEVNFNTMYN
ncbi:unnamed protein product [Arabis nemorensis]|uniref:RRM domain-containing protein n=1 Tax=Arabis nemorensis TaxID=586526 RepID=A0A565CIF5_9BRAS|nr:unnamed protein product [Arabis nemorensis]